MWIKLPLAIPLCPPPYFLEDGKEGVKAQVLFLV